MTGQWWSHDREYTYEDGQTVRRRSLTTGIVWDEYQTHDSDGNRRYQAWVRVIQHDDESCPQVSLWTHNGECPAPVLTVEDCRTLGYALLDAAELVDRERDAAICRFIGDGGQE